MPYYLKEMEDMTELAKVESVLIVPCRFCPAASMAVSKNEPYIELFRGALKTAAYEEFIETIKSDLKKKGVRTNVFKSRLLHQFVLCSWTEKRREEFSEIADKYEALLVLGCEAAVRTINDSVKSTSCKVFQGMETMGIMSIKPRFKLPCNISLEMDSLTPVFMQVEQPEPCAHPNFS
jgi:hypothetical protein